MKYYLSKNASRRLKLGKFTVAFEIVDQFAGAWRGVYATNNPAEIALLDEAAPRLGLVELNEEAYEELKKKAGLTRARSLRRSGLRPTSVSVGSDKPAVTVVERPKVPSASTEVKKDLPDSSDVLKLGIVNVTDNLDKPERRPRRKSSA